MSKHTAPTLLDNKVILVTGAASGIGAAVAKTYALSGATVVLLDKSIPRLELIYDDILASGGQEPALYPLDLKGATVADYDTLVASIKDNFQQLDGLVHCAAVLGQIAPIEHQEPKEWLETLHVNLTAAYLLTRSCLGLMRNSKQASIIFTTDSHKNTAYWSAYGISKAGIEALSLQLADEFENEGRIHVHCIDPGDVNTELHTRAFPALDPTTLPSPEESAESYLQLMLQ